MRTPPILEAGGVSVVRLETMTGIVMCAQRDERAEKDDEIYMVFESEAAAIEHCKAAVAENWEISFSIQGARGEYLCEVHPPRSAIQLPKRRPGLWARLRGVFGGKA